MFNDKTASGKAMRTQSGVTMKKVAERAGVSMMTVSLALRGDTNATRISEETRQRVLDAAKALRYRPNARGRALRSGFTNVIGLYAGYGFVNVRLPFFTEIVSGLQEGCEQFKKDLLLHGTFHGDTAEDIFTELADGRIDGLVVHMPSDNPMAERLVDSHLPAVAVADSLADIPSVVVDDAAGSRLLADYLKERGYRRGFYLSSNLPAVSTRRRRDAFLNAAAHIGLRADEIPADTPEWDDAFLRDLLGPESGREPTVIVCWNDQSAYSLIAYCRQCGLRVPEDVAVVGFDGCPTPYDGVWSLTTIRAPWADAARIAVEHLDTLINGGKVPKETVLPVELRPGNTA
jgi:DNA-binding LacI/PurR family transcriptional regulator